MKNIIILAISILSGIIAFLLAQQHYRAKAKELNNRWGTPVPVLVAKRSILAGEKLTAEASGNVWVLEYPAKVLNKRGKKFDVLTKSDWNTIHTQDHRLSYNIERGEPLRWSQIEGSGFRRQKTFSDAISPKSRGLTLPVDTVTSVNNLIVPNDNVDIIATFNFPMNRADASLASATMILLQNVKVLAVGKNYRGALSAGKGFSSMTLSVTPKEAEMLVFAYQKGKLHFMLRNPKDPYIERDTQDVNFAELEKNITKYIEERARKLKSGLDYERP